MGKVKRALGVLVVLVLMGSVAKSADLTVQAGDGGSLLSEATFSIVGGDLQITLKNIGGDVLVPADLLQGLLFTIAGSPTLSPLSATVTAGSQIIFDYSADDGTNVGGEWGLDYADPSFIDGTALYYVIHAAGWGLDGSPDFGGPDLNKQAALDGMDYGITSLNDNTGTGNSQVTGANPLIKHSVTFVLDLGSTVINPATDIHDVRFGYGTGPQYVTPEPTSFVLAALGLAGAGLLLRRRG